MRNLIIALGSGIAPTLILWLTGLLSLAEASVPGVLVALIAYFVLARRSFKRVETIFMAAQKALSTMPPRLDLAVAEMEKAYAYSNEQFGIRSQVDTQIGVVHFLQQDWNKAMPYLQRSLGFGHWLGGAMLGVIYYKKKDHAQMRQTFALLTKKSAKQGMVWSLYAYLLQQIGDDDGALKVLGEGVKKAKDDERVREALVAVQNGKKIKMKGYREQWYQFHLERPPMDMQQQQMFGGKASRLARRGRW